MFKSSRKSIWQPALSQVTTVLLQDLSISIMENFCWVRQRLKQRQRQHRDKDTIINLSWKYFLYSIPNLSALPSYLLCFCRFCVWVMYREHFNVFDLNLSGSSKLPLKRFYWDGTLVEFSCFSVVFSCMKFYLRVVGCNGLYLAVCIVHWEEQI